MHEELHSSSADTYLSQWQLQNNITEISHAKVLMKGNPLCKVQLDGHYGKIVLSWRGLFHFNDQLTVNDSASLKDTK